MDDYGARIARLEAQMQGIALAATADPLPPIPPDPGPPEPDRTVLASVGFEDGTFSEWGNGHPQDSTQKDGGCGTNSWATVIDAPAGFPGTKAAQLAVYADSVREDGTGKTTVRAQLNANGEFTAAVFGEAYWYEWWLLLPDDPALNNGDWRGWHTLYQHGAYTPGISLQDFGDGDGPVFTFSTYKGTSDHPQADVQQRYPAVLGRPCRMRVYLSWANDASGACEWWVDDEQVIPRTPSQTALDNFDHGPGMDLCMYRDAKKPPLYNTTMVVSGAERYTIP